MILLEQAELSLRTGGADESIRNVYGCGSENPGNEWRARIKVLQRQAMRREDIPTRLKDSIGELWQMGRTYARGNARKAAELRRRIETVLEE